MIVVNKCINKSKTMTQLQMDYSSSRKQETT